MKEKTKKTFLEKLNKYPGWLIFVLIVTTISGLFTIVNGGKGVISIYRDTLGKNRVEENIVNKLSPMVDISYFRDKLGQEITKGSVDEGLTQYIFKRHTYFIKAITDDSDTVLFWSITSCNPKKPFRIIPNKERILNNSANEIDNLNKIVLHKSSFNSVFPDLKNMNPTLFYYLSAATSNSYAVESYYGANPGGYQTIYIGINDACSREVEKMYDYTDYLLNNEINGVELLEIKSSQLLSFRSNSKINVYGESAPFFNIDHLLVDGEIDLGIDRIMTRVLR